MESVHITVRLGLSHEGTPHRVSLLTQEKAVVLMRERISAPARALRKKLLNLAPGSQKKSQNWIPRYDDIFLNRFFWAGGRSALHPAAHKLF